MTPHDAKHRSPSPPPRARRRGAALAVLGAVALLPAAASGADAPEAELVAEALFLVDPLPPGGRDVNLTLALERAEHAETGEATTRAVPRAQLAISLGERLGFTADVGLGLDGDPDPGASLKALLRAPDGGHTGLSASLDVYGSSASARDSEAGVGLGAIRGIGRLGLRAAASVLSGVGAWSPHLHAGASAAVAFGGRWRALAEVVTDVAGGEAEVAAGPTLKVAVWERTALMAGALFRVAPARAAPAVVVQLTQSL